MGAGLLAEVGLVVHLAFIVFALFGGLLTLVWLWSVLAHLPALAWGAYIEHYLLPLVYPPGLMPGVQSALVGALLVVNALFYAVVLVRLQRRRAEPARGLRLG